MAKVRLDDLLVQMGLASDIQQARGLIGAGEVRIDDQCADKAGLLYSEKCQPRLKIRCPFVSRGGFKLQGGLDAFSIDPKGLICADIGASSGGFTDCLLQRFAKKVYAVDVAYGMLDWKLRQDERVVVIERFNARKISRKQIPESLDLAVIDAAFISLTKLIPPLVPLFEKQLAIICLIKPQFELPRKLIPKGGVVTLEEHHQLAIDKIDAFIKSIHLRVADMTTSPILGPKGNREFLVSITN